MALTGNSSTFTNTLDEFTAQSPALYSLFNAIHQVLLNNDANLFANKVDEAYVTQAIASLVNSAPNTLDTLNELATALGDDPNFATTIANAIAGKQPLNGNLTTLSGTSTWDNSATAPSLITRLNYNGYLYATKVFNAVYNDYAEYFEKSDFRLEAGDVVSLSSDGEGYVRSSGANDPLVVGVYSDDFAQCIGGKGDGLDEINFASVGMAGRVRVKVTGDVKRGDLLVASHIEGVAMVGNVQGCIIAKALESHEGEEVHRIRALILNA